MESILSKLKDIIKRAVVMTTDQDDGPFPRTKASSFESPPMSVELIQPYGFYSNPPKGALGITFNIGGDHRNMFGIFNVPSQRFKTVPGEVAIGNPLSKAVIYFRNNGNVDVTIPGILTTTITKNAVITIQGNATMTITGNATVNAANATINASETAAIIAPAITLSDSLNADIADALTKFEELKDWADSHVHEIDSVDTSPPTLPLPATAATTVVQAN